MFSTIVNREAGLVAFLSALTAIGGGLFAPSAQAINLVPQREGEVRIDNLGGCLIGDNDPQCFKLDSHLFEEVISHEVGPDNQRSYLFVDQKGTKNKYYDTINNSYFTFGSKDLGTTEPEDQYWFRPVYVNADQTLAEKGQLEVGSFTFTFKKTLSELNLSLFDVEDIGTSFEVYYGDNDVAETFVSAGSDKNIQDFTLYNVSKIRLNLGNADSSKFSRTGDGVNFQGTASVPEPSMALGAIAAVVGGGMLRQRRQSNADV